MAGSLFLDRLQVLLLMRNLSINLSSPDFEEHVSCTSHVVASFLSLLGVGGRELLVEFTRSIPALRVWRDRPPGWGSSTQGVHAVADLVPSLVQRQRLRGLVLGHTGPSLDCVIHWRFVAHWCCLLCRSCSYLSMMDRMAARLQRRGSSRGLASVEWRGTCCCLRTGVYCQRLRRSVRLSVCDHCKM